MYTLEEQEKFKEMLKLKKKNQKTQEEEEKLAKLEAIYNKKQLSIPDLERELADNTPKPVPTPTAAPSPTPTSITFKSTALDSIIEAYESKYSKLPAYQAPERRDGGVKLFFVSEEEAVSFALEQAKANHRFEMFDSQRRLIAYSNGDGKLYHPNKTEFKPGDLFSVPEIKEMPQPVRPIVPPSSPGSVSSAPQPKS